MCTGGKGEGRSALRSVIELGRVRIGWGKGKYRVSKTGMSQICADQQEGQASQT